MIGFLASQVQSGGKPLLLTLAEEDDGSSWVIRAQTQQQDTARQQWKKVLGYAPYPDRDGLFQFGYAYVNEALGRSLSMVALGAYANPKGGVVRAWPTSGVESNRFHWNALWGLRMPNEETKVSELLAAQSRDPLYVVLDIANSAEGAEVITFASHGGRNQKWVFVPLMSD